MTLSYTDHTGYSYSLVVGDGTLIVILATIAALLAVMLREYFLTPEIPPKRSQLENIKAYLLAGNSINQHQAFEKFGCKRLASRVNDLKKSGIPVRSKLTPAGAVYSV